MNLGKIESVLGVLQSPAFEPVVMAIRNKCPDAAEGILRYIECEQTEMLVEGIINHHESWLIDQAIEECYRRIELMRGE